MHSVSQLTKKKTGCGDENITTHPRNHAFPDKILAVPINGTGTGTWGRGRLDARRGTWDSGARDKGFRDVKLSGCGDAKYGKWESHVKYGTRPQAKYRTWGRNCTILLWLEPAFNVHRVNSFLLHENFYVTTIYGFYQADFVFYTYLPQPIVSQTKYSCSPASWSHSIVN